MSKMVMERTGKLGTCLLGKRRWNKIGWLVDVLGCAAAVCRQSVWDNIQSSESRLCSTGCR